MRYSVNIEHKDGTTVTATLDSYHDVHLLIQSWLEQNGLKKLLAIEIRPTR